LLKGIQDAHDQTVFSVAYHPTEQRFLAGQGDRPNKREAPISTWKLLNKTFWQGKMLMGHTDDIYSMAFSPDGKYLATGGDGILLWEVTRTGYQLVAEYKDQEAYVSSVLFTLDGKYLLSGEFDGGIKVLSLEGQKLKLVDTLNHQGTIWGMAFHPEGQYLLTASSFKTVKIWYPPPHDNHEVTEIILDQQPPEITISHPPTQRGFKIKHKQATILVEGTAWDESGIDSVVVNGQPAHLDQNGAFHLELSLKVGENLIKVEASDTFGNRQQQLVIVDQSQPMQHQFGRYHALVIAVQDYQHQSINDLDFPLQDCQQLSQILQQDYGFAPEDTYFLRNPTRSAIIDQLDQLAGQLTNQDNLLVFYSGHGYWDEQLKQGFWLPADARKESRADWLSNGTLRDYIGAIQSQHTLLISDACFSGSIFKTRLAFNEVANQAVEQVYSRPSRKAISSGAMEVVPDRSVFLQYLVTNLKRNTASYLYAEKLYVEMKPAIINNSPTHQAPLFGVIQRVGDEGGDFIFIRNKLQTADQISTVTTSADSTLVDPEAEMWEMVKNSTEMSDLKDFLQAFPEGRLAPLARLKLKQLERNDRPSQ